MYHRFYAESCLRDLLSEGPKATAGRIYDGDAMFLLHGSLKMYGIAARVVLEPETSVQQQEVFSKLVKELENGSCVRVDIFFPLTVSYLIDAVLAHCAIR